ncbi:unnamed protein product [Pieris macdunnoughi]|uniref:Uncharacterized protein n=1 Tax=Pieris macdunnoughi TaxID=345717 RepID=A0A821RSU0_9NEOP|nr:unnamed protein product [Pieris macdunnoughi]
MLFKVYKRPLPRSKNGGILIMQVVYETCLTRIEEKKVAGKFAYNSIPLRPACDPPSMPPLLVPPLQRRTVRDQTLSTNACAALTDSTTQN